MMTSATGVREETAAAPLPERSTFPEGLRARHILILAIWCGLVAGPLEVAAILVRKHTVDLNQFTWMTRHFVWLIPITDLLLLLAIGAVLAPVAGIWSERGGRLATRLLCALTLLPAVWAAFPRIYAIAGLLLALGLAAWLVPVLEGYAAGVRRFVGFSFPLLTVVTPLLAGSIWAGDWRKQRQEEARPLPPAGAPNMLLIVLDTVGADHLGLHGYHRPTSPTLDELARRGIRFDRVQATCSWTLPSHAGFFTGRWPHELSTGWLTPLDDTHPTLAGYLGSRGYATAGFVGNLFYCGADTGLERGFTRYQDYIFRGLGAFKLPAMVDRPIAGMRAIDDFLRSRINSTLFQPLLLQCDAGNRKPAATVSREFLDWLGSRGQPERPFFAFLNYFDVHYPYKLPEGGVHRFGSPARTEREMQLIENWRTTDKHALTTREIAFMRDSYDDGIADLDEQLGRLIDELDRRQVLENTWLIVTSDHGESFGEQPGTFLHGTSLYQPQLHVPLVIVPPASAKSPSPRVVSETVSLRDLPATVVDLLDLETGSPFPGTSLTRLWGTPPSATAADRPGPGPSPGLSELVQSDPLDPDPAHLLEHRAVWAALTEGDSIYIQVRFKDALDEGLYDLRRDPQQAINRIGEAAAQPTIDQMRTRLDQLTAGPLTFDRLRP